MQTNIRCGCGSIIPAAGAPPGSRVPCPGCARPFYVGGAHSMRDQRRSRLATPAMILGLLPVTAPAGALLGAVAALRIGFSAGRRTGMAAALLGAGGGLLWTWLALAVALPALLAKPAEGPAVAVLSPSEQIMTVNLRSIGTAQLEYYYKYDERYDVDDDGRGPRFWTVDVAGLHFVTDKTEKPASLIPIALALADAAPLGWDEIPGKTVPASGYAYRVLDPQADPQAGVIVVAIPQPLGAGATVTGVMTVTTQGYAVYSKDTGGAIPAPWPADPGAAGWTRR